MISISKLALAFVGFMFCLALSLIIPDAVTMTGTAEGLVQGGFIVLGIIVLFLGGLRGED